jgi:hypothetical protein
VKSYSLFINELNEAAFKEYVAKVTAECGYTVLTGKA